MKIEVEITGLKLQASGDASGLREALAPLFGLLGVTLGSTMPGKTVAFLAAHGFTVEDFNRGRQAQEGVEAFVARRELEQAGVKFTRTAPGRSFPHVDLEPPVVPDHAAGVRAHTKSMVSELARGASLRVVDGAPAKPRGCGLYPTEKGEAVPSPTSKPETKRARAARLRASDEQDALHSGAAVPFSRKATTSKRKPRKATRSADGKRGSK